MRRLDNAIWFEKFRPKTLAQMSLSVDNVEAFESFIEDENIPHLLLVGPPGGGKTTVANILINFIPCTAMSLNASSKDRGIETIRGKVKTFASSKQMQGRLKIVFFDEADYMTPEAQAALRNTMETYSSYCRFILTANHPDKIIDAIKSRCITFNFNQFPKENLQVLVRKILRKELIAHDKEDLDFLINRFYPDIRTIINELQSASVSGKFEINKIKSTSVSPEELFKAISEGKIYTIREHLINETDYTWVYRFLYDKVVPELGNNQQKADMVMQIAEYLNADPICPDKEINIAACLVSVMLCLEINPKF